MPTNTKCSETQGIPTRDLSHLLNVYRVLFRCPDQKLPLRMRACVNDLISSIGKENNHDKLVLNRNDYCGIQNEDYGEFEVIVYVGAKPFSLIVVVPECMFAFPFRSYSTETVYGLKSFNDQEPWFCNLSYDEYTYSLKRNFPDPFKLKRATGVYEAIQWYERFQLLPNIFRTFRPYKLLKSLSLGGKTIENSDRFHLFRSSYDPYYPVVYQEQESEYYKKIGNDVDRLVPLWIRFCIPTYTVEFIHIQNGQLVTTKDAKIEIPKSLWDKAISKYINGDMVMNSLSPQAAVPDDCEEVGVH